MGRRQEVIFRGAFVPTRFDLSRCVHNAVCRVNRVCALLNHFARNNVFVNMLLLNQVEMLI